MHHGPHEGMPMHHHAQANREEPAAQGQRARRLSQSDPEPERHTSRRTIWLVVVVGVLLLAALIVMHALGGHGLH